MMRPGLIMGYTSKGPFRYDFALIGNMLRNIFVRNSPCKTLLCVTDNSMKGGWWYSAYQQKNIGPKCSPPPQEKQGLCQSFVEVMPLHKEATLIKYLIKINHLERSSNTLSFARPWKNVNSILSITGRSTSDVSNLCQLVSQSHYR